jgi:hypothetical protein
MGPASFPATATSFHRSTTSAEVTRAAYEARADGAFSNEQEALRWLEDYFAHARDSIQ